MHRFNDVAFRLLFYCQDAGNRIKGFLNKPAVLIIAAVLLTIVAAPNIAYAWDPQTGATNVFNFIKFIVIIVVAVCVVNGLLKSQMVFAVTVVILGGTLYVLLDEQLMKALGQGIAHLLGLGGGEG